MSKGQITGAQGIFEREVTAYADEPYADTDTYANGFENKPQKRIPKAGAKAEAGVGQAGAQWSATEDNVPNTFAEATAEGLEAVSAVTGPIEASLGMDTGIPEDITGETAG
ncbi:hypothetical protein KOW79_011065 [Hemibagrus wyckioides]|uniref:Uncharacterized protein n=1 Tax=Hemibagrus wyckioides TaxID=337641 RepID=A0A9D3NMQ2_9TELE|nr:hypothetical protein KOW79_011065 [Hemibagrus wyckioides]